MKKLLSTLLISSSLISASAFAGEKTSNDYSNPWQVRLRTIQVNAGDADSTLSIGGAANAEPDTVPELDITYFVNRNFAFELILATTEHEMSAKGSSLGSYVDLGKVNVLPPTLTAQYHLDICETIKPYVGAGVNYTFFYDVEKGAGLDRVEYEDGFGYALQMGSDFMYDEHWGLNLDVKKIYLNTDVSINNGAIRGDVDLDPWVFGVGVTYKF
ncbi:MAG: OmpW family outer membrane protein [Rickettsiales bacterium]|nr:OmpW family outer membrane protein [Rickettsiales bacterium]